MIGSGSVCTVEGVKVSAFIFPPYETGRAMASLPGGGRQETARDRRGNNENAVLYIYFPRKSLAAAGAVPVPWIKKQVQRYSGSR